MHPTPDVQNDDGVKKYNHFITNKFSRTDFFFFYNHLKTLGSQQIIRDGRKPEAKVFFS
jgi:hypothetical protein